MSEWRGARVAVTGGAGFIGAHLARRLARLGAQVCLLAPETVSLERLGPLQAEVERIAVDVRNGPMVRRAMAQAAPEVVFHLAAAGVQDPFLPLEQALRVNVSGTVHVIQAARQARRIVVAGTAHELGDRAGGGLDPISTYAASKAAAWAFARMLHRTEGAPVVGVRPFQVYGPGQPASGVLGGALAAARANQDFPMTGGAQVRDWVYVDDVVEGMLAAGAAEGVAGEIFELGTGAGRTLLSVIERVYALAGAAARPRPGSLPYRPGEVMRLVADPRPAAERLKWTARTGLDEGLLRLVECA